MNFLQRENSLLKKIESSMWYEIAISKRRNFEDKTQRDQEGDNEWVHFKILVKISWKSLFLNILKFNGKVPSLHIKYFVYIIVDSCKKL